MYDAVVKLIAESRTVDAYGDLVTEETERSVFAEIKSIGQSEFYQAQAVGLKPEIKFVLADYLEYQNEKKLRYQGFNEAVEEEYTILRTYRQNNLLELVCKRGVD
jgi:SPP1 family predicted phage head-tail adaptor